MNQEKKDKKINNLISLFTSGAIEDCKKETLKVLEIYPSNNAARTLVDEIEQTIKNETI